MIVYEATITIRERDKTYQAEIERHLGRSRFSGQQGDVKWVEGARRTLSDDFRPMDRDRLGVKTTCSKVDTGSNGLNDDLVSKCVWIEVEEQYLNAVGGNLLLEWGN